MQVLQWMRDYAGLMVPLPSQQQQLWAGIAELFDNYLLACFVLFSGVTLQSLVWQDDCLPNRLRSALLRITTQSNCKYKAEVGRGSCCWPHRLPAMHLWAVGCGAACCMYCMLSCQQGHHYLP